MAKKKNTGLVNKLKGSKRFMFLFVTGLILLASSSVFAVWVLNYDTTTGLIISSENVDFFDTLSVQLIDTTSEGFVSEEIINITNPDGNRLVLLTYETNITDVGDSCDNTNDVSIDFNYEGLILTNGTLFNITSGNTVLDINITALPQSCPSSNLFDINIVG